MTKIGRRAVPTPGSTTTSAPSRRGSRNTTGQLLARRLQTDLWRKPVHGLQNFLGDLARNGGLPAQVDARKFAVGKNLATTPGSVIYRDAVMELIQYRPLGPEVHQRPLLIAPPQINKFYVFDLVPEKEHYSNSP